MIAIAIAAVVSGWTPAAAQAVSAPADDPILAMARADQSDREFRLLVAKAVSRHPTIGEAVATSREAAAARLEARSALWPSADLTANSYRVLARNFNPQDLSTVYENSRARPRTDLLATVSQTVFDFGASANRISAATARLRAAAMGIDDAADRVALATIAAWYDIYTYRALIALTAQRREGERGLRGDLGVRVARGVSADGDLLRVDSALAATDTRAASYRRQLANAEARFRELSGEPPPETLTRVPATGPAFSSGDMVRAAADRTPGVRAAAAQAEAARRDARASRAERYPNLSANLLAGRYGVLEDKPDYDVRGQVTIRQRFSGGLIAQSRQVDARAIAAAARADRAREEAERDAAIAWGDVRALDDQVEAARASYVAGRDARAMLVERFRLARGNLFDVLQADDAAFAAAAAYIESIGERDAARYVLLSRTGRLLDTLDIDTAALGGARVKGE